MSEIDPIFRKLGRGVVLYAATGRPGPFLAEVPLAPIPKACDEARRQQEAKNFQLLCNVDRGLAWESVHKEILKASISSATAPSESDLRLLRECAIAYARPLHLSDLAAKAGIGGPEASNSSRRLVQLGLAERQEAAIARNRLIFLVPTPKGWDAITMCQPTGAGRGNAPHRYCLSLLEDHLHRKGFATQREAEINGKRIDLVAKKGASVILAEVEMSASNAARNAVADLAVAGPEVKQIAVICPTQSGLRQVRKAVESAVDTASLTRFAFKLVSDL